MDASTGAVPVTTGTAVEVVAAEVMVGAVVSTVILCVLAVESLPTLSAATTEISVASLVESVESVALRSMDQVPSVAVA